MMMLYIYINPTTKYLLYQGIYNYYYDDVLLLSLLFTYYYYYC